MKTSSDDITASSMTILFSSRKTIKRKFGIQYTPSKNEAVNWEVILRRLLTFKKVKQPYYSEKGDEFKKLFSQKESDSGFTDYAVKIFSYNGEPYIRLVISNFEAGNITASDVSNYLKYLDKMEPMFRKAVAF